jgi:TPP-dependent pyruvate/acetoin dehydrogenase alpha subunit
VQEWQEKDPIGRLSRQMMEAGLLTDAELTALEQRVADEIQAAIEYAQASPDPDPGSILEGVYA